MGVTVLFGRYRLLERAGRGGTAEVWRAVDDRTGDEVAVKRLHPLVFASRAGRDRLLREFRALRDLRHPNVVRVRDLELTDDDGALVLDYVDGSSVRERLAEGRPVPAADAVAIAANVAAALTEAHRRGLVHRDVTPGNILLDTDGRARLTDFGIARGTGDTTVMTSAGMLIGTLRYLAPEQLRGEDATPASDLYALGAVTYELLAGRPAFAAATPVGLVDAQRTGPAPIAGVPPALDAAVRRALSVDPADRQRSVAAFAHDLEAGLAGGLGVATGSVAARRSAPLPALVAIAFGALVVAALALGGAPNDGAGTTVPTEAAPTPAATPAPEAEAGAGNGEDDDDDDDDANEGRDKDGDDDDKAKGKGKGKGSGNGNGKGKGNDD